MAWPAWWDWELELTPHLEQRMEDRDFTEVDLRDMLHRATAYRDDPTLAGRYIVSSSLRGRSWAVIVEPDPGALALVVVTAYCTEVAS